MILIKIYSRKSELALSNKKQMNVRKELRIQQQLKLPLLARIKKAP